MRTLPCLSLPAAILLLVLAGCASIEHVNRVETTAEEALRTAQEALRTAREAQAAAQKARQENRERTRRMFEKAMQK